MPHSDAYGHKHLSDAKQVPFPKETLSIADRLSREEQEKISEAIWEVAADIRRLRNEALRRQSNGRTPLESEPQFFGEMEAAESPDEELL